LGSTCTPKTTYSDVFKLKAAKADGLAPIQKYTLTGSISAGGKTRRANLKFEVEIHDCSSNISSWTRQYNYPIMSPAKEVKFNLLTEMLNGVETPISAVTEAAANPNCVYNYKIEEYYYEGIYSSTTNQLTVSTNYFYLAGVQSYTLKRILQTGTA